MSQVFQPLNSWTETEYEFFVHFLYVPLYLFILFFYKCECFPVQDGILSWSGEPCSAGVQDTATAWPFSTGKHSHAADHHHQHVHHTQCPRQR